MSEEWVPHWRENLARELGSEEPERIAHLASWPWEQLAGTSDFPREELSASLRDLQAALEKIQPPDGALRQAFEAISTASDPLRFQLTEALERTDESAAREQLEAFGRDLADWTRQRGTALSEGAETLATLTGLSRAVSGRAQLWARELDSVLSRLEGQQIDPAAAAAVAAGLVAELDRAWSGMMRQVQP